MLQQAAPLGPGGERVPSPRPAAGLPAAGLPLEVTLLQEESWGEDGADQLRSVKSPGGRSSS